MLTEFQAVPPPDPVAVNTYTAAAGRTSCGHASGICLSCGDVNKNGRFCQAHLNLREVCGIIPCKRPVHSPGALTCDTQSHIYWHQNRFSWLFFPGVWRVIRRQHETGEATGHFEWNSLPSVISLGTELSIHSR
jgi:hypothetical protein